jgi:hypothetical protein
MKRGRACLRLVATVILLSLGCATNALTTDTLLTGKPGAKKVAPGGSEPPGTRRARVDGYHADRSTGHQIPGHARALRRVPRHEFIEDGLFASAYGDYRAIGPQTISQPFIVGLMTDLLQVRRRAGPRNQDRLRTRPPCSRLAQHVVSIEIVTPLAQSAAASNGSGIAT